MLYVYPYTYNACFLKNSSILCQVENHLAEFICRQQTEMGDTSSWGPDMDMTLAHKCFSVIHSRPVIMYSPLNPKISFVGSVHG